MHKFETLDGFIAFDLVDPPASVGVTRLAPKILADGAQLLARSLTYQFATFERQVAGASAGINAKPDEREAAVEAFVAEVTPLVAAGTFCTQAGRGLSDDDLASLRGADPRSELFWEHGASLRGLGVAVAADTALGGIDGRAVTVEAYDDAFPALVRGVAERGGRLVGVSSTAGFVSAPSGLDIEGVAQAWDAHGPGLVDELDGQKVDAVEIFATEADALIIGSKAGLLDHEVAERVAARVVVPSGPVPVTAKALAFLRRAEVAVVPDFVATAGPLFAMWPDDGATIESVRAGAIVAIIAALGEVLDHADGPLLGSCYRAESFLQTWQESLPFGRPIA